MKGFEAVHEISDAILHGARAKLVNLPVHVASPCECHGKHYDIEMIRFNPDDKDMPCIEIILKEE